MNPCIQSRRVEIVITSGAKQSPFVGQASCPSFVTPASDLGGSAGVPAGGDSTTGTEAGPTVDSRVRESALS